MPKIIFEKSKCIGCGSCAAVCPKYWEMGDDNKALLKNSKPNQGNKNEEAEVSKVGCNKEAAEVCPVQCVRIKD
jgi:ferredoxin